MILPGISGSFILVLLGKYFYIMEAVNKLDFIVLGVFAFGALLGITSFSRVLSYALKHFRNITLSVLTGFMLGSLNKVWPWKEVVETYTDTHGEVKPLVENNILPDEYLVEGNYIDGCRFCTRLCFEKLSAEKSKIRFQIKGHISILP